MKTPPAKMILCLLAGLFIALACASSNRNSKSLTLKDIHPNDKSPSPKTAAEEAQQKKSADLKRLQASVSEYAKLPGSSRLTGRPYITGKAIAISKDQEEEEYGLDRSVLSGTDEAESPEEVGTVILIKNHKQKFGTYTTTSSGTIPGYVLLADVVIVDRSLGAVIFRKTFRGDRPGDLVNITRGASEVTGSGPDDKIREFLEKLPHK
jgi:hypothetical protein